MATRLIIPPPKIVPPPSNMAQVQLWLGDLATELTRWFDKATLLLVDRRLFTSVERQVVTAGFTIEPIAPFIELVADSPVGSSATNAIANGDDAQILMIQNISASPIVIMHGATVRLHGAADYTMFPRATLTVRWDGTNWIELSHSTNTP